MSAESSILHHVRARHRLNVLQVQEAETKADLRNYKMGIDGGSSPVPLEGIIFKSEDHVKSIRST